MFVMTLGDSVVLCFGDYVIRKFENRSCASIFLRPPVQYEGLPASRITDLLSGVVLSGGPAYYVEPRPRCTACKPSRTPRQVVNSFVRWIPPIVGTCAVTIIFTIMWWNYQFGHPLGGIHLGWSLLHF